MEALTKDFKNQIEAQNELNSFAKKVVVDVLEQLQPFIGKKIFLADESKAKSFDVDCRKINPTQIEGKIVQVNSCYLMAKYNKLTLKISLCFIENGRSKYVDKHIDLGMCRGNQILENLETTEAIIDSCGLNNVLDFEAELSKVKELRALEAKADEIKRAIKISLEFYKYM